MRKKGFRLLAWLLIMCMLVSVVPAVSAKAVDVLPTIEQICEMMDPIIGDFEVSTIGMYIPWRIFTENKDLTSFLAKTEGSYHVEAITDGYKIQHDTDENVYIEFLFEGDKLVSVYPKTVGYKFCPVEGRDYEPPLLVCNDPSHVYAHKYVGELKDGVVRVFRYENPGQWSMNLTDMGKDVFPEGFDYYVGMMYYKDNNETFYVCKNCQHVLGTYHAAVDPVCTTAGNVEYYECTKCGTNINSDYSEIKDVVVTNPNAHVFSKEWSMDETSHWRNAVCGHDIGKIEEAEHIFVDSKCSTCGYSKAGYDDENKPGDEDNKPGDEDNKPGDEDNKPGTEDNKPGDEDNKPGTEDNKPGEDENKPGIEDNNGNNDSSVSDNNVEIKAIKGTDYDTLDVITLSKPNGKFKALTISGNNGVLTVNAGTKLLMENSNWSVKGYYDGRVTSAIEAVKWNATSGEKADVKALKKYTTVKYSKKTNATKITTKNNKKVAGSVYAVKLVDDKNNIIILNIERDEINKAVKKTRLTKAVSANSVSENALANMKDSTSVKTVNLSLAKLPETEKSRFNNNAITWKLGSGKKAVKLEVNKIVTVNSKKGIVAFVMVTEDASVKVLSGSNKGTVKLTAVVDNKAFKTSIKIK